AHVSRDCVCRQAEEMRKVLVTIPRPLTNQRGQRKFRLGRGRGGGAIDFKGKEEQRRGRGRGRDRFQWKEEQGEGHLRFQGERENESWQRETLGEGGTRRD